MSNATNESLAQSIQDLDGMIAQNELYANNARVLKWSESASEFEGMIERLKKVRAEFQSELDERAAIKPPRQVVEAGA